MSPLRVEISGEGIIILSDGERFRTCGVSMRVRGPWNEVVVPHIIDINFKSDSLVKIRPFSAVSTEILLEKGGMELEYDNKKINISVVNYRNNKKN